MTAKETVDSIRMLISCATCTEREIYEELMAEAEGWKMRLQELDDDE